MLLLWPLAGLAQTTDDDEGFLTELIQDNLSGDARVVDIVGFAGALSSEATIERLTVADEDGVWLTVEDIVLSWNRRALLRGAIDVSELRAARIILARAPISQDSGPAPEAAPFSLPELPVSVSLDALDIAEIIIADAFLGDEIRVSLTGQAQLAGGEGAANIVATRLGETLGVFEINGSYINETRFLDLLVKLEEGADGIAASLLDLPGRPAVALSVAGAAPLDDFAADIALATDGTDRLAGRFALAQVAGDQTISLDVSGDVSPLFATQYKGFFGDDASLIAEIVRAESGRIAVPQLTLNAGRVALNGRLVIDAQGWPEVIDLRGGITPQGSAPVLLPLTGPQTFVDGMDIVVAYDGGVSDEWQADISVAGLTRPGLVIETLGLQGGGLLRSGTGAQVGAVTVNLDYGATGVTLQDTGAAEAFGDTLTGELVAARLEGETTNLSRFTLSGAGLDARLSGTIAGPDAGFQADLAFAAGIAGLDRFSTLIGQDLGGAAQVDADIVVVPADGSFDVTLRGQTTDLSVGIAQADAVLAGRGQIEARAVRDTDGTRLEQLSVTTDAARLQAAADLTNTGADGQIDLRLSDLGLVLAGVSGPATLRGDIAQDAQGAIDFGLSGTAPAANFATQGTMTPSQPTPLITAEIVATLSDIGRYAAVIGQPVSGAVTLAGGGTLQADLSTLDVEFTGRSDDLVTGIAQIDPLLAGNGTFAAQVSRDAQTVLEITDLSLAFPQMSLSGDAGLGVNEQASADLRFRIADAGLIAPSLAGPVTVEVKASPAPDNATAVTARALGAGVDIAADVVVAAAAQNREITGELQASVADLAAYADLVGQPIAGAIDLRASGALQPDLTGFDAQLNLRSTDLAAGIPTLDPLLAGDGQINATVGLADGVLAVRTLEVSTREVFIVGALNGAAGLGQGRFNASLRDVGVLTDQISGPIRATGAASLDEAGNWGVDANATGPGGLQAQIVGQIAQTGDLALDIDGSAPLALANTAIDPRRLSGLANFDLNVNGPPALASLGGQVTFSNGRLAAPNLGQALTDIGGRIALANGVAQIDLTTRVEGGGGIAINGPVGLTGTNQADIAVTLDRVVLQDPELYATTVAGRISLVGPLQGGARISGELELGQTDIQVPSSAISSLGSLPEVRHVNAPADVRRTLARAGVFETDENGTSGRGGGRAFPLDIVINAPSRIFIRGRGLDAELGGRLTIGGTSSEVIPTGRFELVRGRLDILQQRFQLSEGTATLQGDFEPFLRLVAQTETSNGTIVSIVVEGPAGTPEVSFNSIPELPQDEVLAQLIFGRDLESISPLQAIQLAAAVSTLAGRGGGALDRLREGIGLDDFDVTTDDEGNAAVRAGAYLSENVYTDVIVTSEGDTEINLNLDITSEIIAKGSVNQDGETSIGLFFERDY